MIVRVSAVRLVSRGAIGVVMAAVVVYQIYALYLQPVGHVSHPPVQPLVRVQAAGSSVVSQAMRLEANGLTGVTVFPVAGESDSAGDATFELYALPDDYPRVTGPVVLVARQTVPLDRVVRADHFDWRFDRQASSRGRVYRLDVSVAGAADRGLALWANAADRHAGGVLSVAGVQQWGDLAFSTTTDRPTAAVNAATNLSAYVGGGGAVVFGATLVILNGILLAVWWGVLGSVGRRGAHPAWLVAPKDLATSLLSLVIVVALVGAIRSTGVRVDAAEPGSVDLLAAFPEAEKRTTFGTLHEAFDLQDVTIAGVRRPSLLALPFSRVTWTVEVPPDAVLRAAVAFRPDTWTREGDGAMFRIGVSHGTRYEEVYRRYLAPYASAADRRWYNVEADLSSFAGARVSLIFNTEPGELGNAVADATVWGAPRLVPRASARVSTPRSP